MSKAIPEVRPARRSATARAARRSSIAAFAPDLRPIRQRQRRKLAVGSRGSSRMPRDKSIRSPANCASTTAIPNPSTGSSGCGRINQSLQHMISGTSSRQPRNRTKFRGPVPRNAGERPPPEIPRPQKVPPLPDQAGASPPEHPPRTRDFSRAPCVRQRAESGRFRQASARAGIPIDRRCSHFESQWNPRQVVPRMSTPVRRSRPAIKVSKLWLEFPTIRSAIMRHVRRRTGRMINRLRMLGVNTFSSALCTWTILLLIGRPTADIR